VLDAEVLLTVVSVFAESVVVISTVVVSVETVASVVVVTVVVVSVVVVGVVLVVKVVLSVVTVIVCWSTVGGCTVGTPRNRKLLSPLDCSSTDSRLLSSAASTAASASETL
jgi:hypothetical protein